MLLITRTVDACTMQLKRAKLLLTDRVSTTSVAWPAAGTLTVPTPVNAVVTPLSSTRVRLPDTLVYTVPGAAASAPLPPLAPPNADRLTVDAADDAACTDTRPPPPPAP